MNIYKVDSKWSRELIRAKDIAEAVAKYEKRNSKIEKKDREIIKVENLGELFA